MTDYISREAAIETIKRLYPGVPLVKLNLDKWYEKNKAYMECETAIDKLPAADVRPVVRGKWVQDCDYHFRCSICGDRWTVSNGNPLDISNGWNFCPNCGADMREES